MKKTFIIYLLFLLTFYPVRADEGMWLLPLLEKLNISTMQKMGCELTAEQIYSINHSSLKDAIVIFGGGCTGEMVSKEGLLLTNHHCGYGAIQQHSSVEHDYLSDGFWAGKRSEELYTPNLTVTFLVRVEDVTEQINALINDTMTEVQRADIIDKTGAAIVDRAIKDTHYKASVRSYFGGNQFYLLVYEEFIDVRMVGAPPSSIGKFGADTDNWMWPRHTGDFSLFRVYADAEGKPAKYSPDNVPLKPRHFLPVSLKGIEKDDFTMVMGYPGGTDRYMTSYDVKELIEDRLPARIKIRGEKQEIMMRHMQADPAVRIKYASKYSRSSNYWKHAIGQIKGIGRLDVYGRKQEQEQRFMKWTDADSQRKEKYGDALSLIKSGMERNQEINMVRQYVSECFFQGVELFGFSLQFQMLARELEKEKPEQEKLKFVTETLQKSAGDFYKDYDLSLDKEVTEAMFKRYFSDVSPDYYPDFYQTIDKKYKGDIQKYTQDWFKKSIFSDSLRLEAFLKKPSLKVLLNDPVYQASAATRKLLNQWNN
ncbi:MAG: S46 family peptidase, partial [Bacteroidales bacterium]|nr:S46 family peptidase [Bacteroidales bacterium]